MSILSIHIDESGNLNLSNKQNTEYRITLVFHNQAEDISSAIVFLDNKLRWIGLDVPFIHTMPLIRQDKPFENLLREERQRIFNTFASFVATIPITYTSFSAVKSFYSAVPQMQIAFEHQIMDFIRHHLDYFQSFEKVVLYYDWGQAFVSKILQNTFAKTLGQNVEFRTAYQKDYKLMQVADYICALEQSKSRWDNNSGTKSEKEFFGSRVKFIKNYYKKIERKRFS